MEFKNKGSRYRQQDEEERVIAACVQFPENSAAEIESDLEELNRLIETVGGKVIEQVIQRRARPDPSTYVGSGKVEELAQRAKDAEISLIVFDGELSGTQQKNLETGTGCRVVDRTGIILDIFSKHARTKEAKTQVEVATLEYLLTHLTRRWTHLERQRGGIGLRGVGERQIELDRRLIRRRISKLKEELLHMVSQRSVQRHHRDRFLRVAIVGYTNAGKSTLMNHLTVGEVYVDDRLFATLDSTVRVIDPKTRPPILLSDTVGFIKNLPHSLVASFKSTLAEVLDADVLLHVVDLSSPNFRDQMKVTDEVLEEIGAGDKPTFLVFNKADRVKDVLLPKIVERKYIDSLAVSAYSPADMQKLRNSIYGFFERDMMELEVVVPYKEAELQSQIYEHSKVLETKYQEDGTWLRIKIMRWDASQLKLIP
ncbi:MAG: GTPase HflX [Deltaproteobacteria bacterium]|nr:GTPase HflX [Deltaproteobacteria bacterium]MBI3294318.1 GTPase HflX [Deltaproteobacteria bacterium]